MDDSCGPLASLRQSWLRAGSPCHVLAGLSGGADSTALLLLLCALRAETGLTLSAAHVNHGLRESAGDDEAFARGLCERLGVRFYISKVRVAAGGSTEDAARRARYAAFDDMLARSGANALALAHHMDDQAETMLLHLLYGGGAQGLGGMREVSGRVWRPLLDVRRAELLAYLRSVGQDWREDESNSDRAFTRNRLRLDVFPVLESVAPSAVPSMCRAAAILRDEGDHMEAQAALWLAGRTRLTPPYRFVETGGAEDMDTAMLRRVVRRFAHACGVPALDFAQTVRLCRLAAQSKAGEADNLPGGWTALRTKARLHLLPPQPEAPGDPGWAITRSPCADGLGDGKISQAFPNKALGGAALRTRRPGDFIRPFGMEGSKPLKAYLMERGVDRPFRDGWPLLCRDDEVLWVIGVGASECARVKWGDDAVLLAFQGRLPDEPDETEDKSDERTHERP